MKARELLEGCLLAWVVMIHEDEVDERYFGAVRHALSMLVDWNVIDAEMERIASKNSGVWVCAYVDPDDPSATAHDGEEG